MASHDQFEIMTGPSKFDIMVSLFDGVGDNQRSVVFRVVGFVNGFNEKGEGLIDPVSVRIWQAAREGGRSDTQWVLKGKIGAGAEEQRVGICYDLKKRSGTLYFDFND